MEIKSKNGSKIQIKENGDFGRGLGFNSDDLTVSRRHISFKPHKDRTGVYFEVHGKNPIWVHDSGSDEIRVYRRSERGEMKSGDSFCVSSKNPIWFNLKRTVSEDEDNQDMDEFKKELRFDDEFTESSGIDDVDIQTADFSHIDPVKEFNFVVMGHEFDCYKKKIRDIKKWDWFLEEHEEESDDDDEIREGKRKKGVRRKRKKGGGEDDDDVWTGESEEDAEEIKKLRKVPKPKYSTRSKDSKKNKNGTSASKNTKNTETIYRREIEDEDEDEDDEDDDTLGGFIVDDEDIGDEGNGEDEEEEDFEDDDDE